jgi:hypothetical protein
VATSVGLPLSAVATSVGLPLSGQTKETELKWLMALGSQYNGDGCQVSFELLQFLGTTNQPTQPKQTLLSNPKF